MTKTTNERKRSRRTITPRRGTPSGARSVGFDSRIDWPAVRANLEWLHAATNVISTRASLGELHEAIHDLARACGAPDDFLHPSD